MSVCPSERYIQYLQLLRARFDRRLSICLADDKVVPGDPVIQTVARHD